MSPVVAMKWFVEWLGDSKVAVTVYSRHLPGEPDKIKITLSKRCRLPQAESPVNSKNDCRSLPLHQAGLFQAATHRALATSPSYM
jgi:hypothetical protein